MGKKKDEMTVMKEALIEKLASAGEDARFSVTMHNGVSKSFTLQQLCTGNTLKKISKKSLDILTNGKLLSVRLAEESSEFDDQISDALPSETE